MSTEQALTKFLIPLETGSPCAEATALMRCIAGLLEERVDSITLLHATGGRYLSEHMANVDVRAARVISTDMFTRLRQAHIDTNIMPALEKVRGELQKAGIEAGIDLLIEDGDPVDCIVETANRGGYSSLIIERKSSADSGLGHVTSGVLHRDVRATIYLTGTRPIQCPPATCLVALDGSDNSWKALERAAILAAAAGDGARVVLVNVIDVAEQSRRLAEGKEDLAIEADILDRAVKLLEEQGISGDRVVSRQVAGVPAEVLVEEVEKHQAEMVFMGRRDRGVLKELFMGSVSSRLISHCQEQTIVMYG